MFLDKIIKKYVIESYIAPASQYTDHLINVRENKECFRRKCCVFILNNIKLKEIKNDYNYLKAIINYADIDKLLLLKPLMYKATVKEFVKRLTENTVS